MKTPIFLFDIDGTLLRGDGAGRRAMVAAFEETFGDARGFEGLGFGGLTDRRIVRLAAEAQGLSLAEEEISRVLATYRIRMDAECRDAGVFDAIPGACEVASHLAATRPGTTGLGTGNIASVAYLKVESVGLRGVFGFGGFGDDAEDRAEMLRIGIARGAAVCGVALAAARPIVIGDTVRDVQAARAVGAEVVTVATGYEDLQRLLEARADAHFDALQVGSFEAWLAPKG